MLYFPEGAKGNCSRLAGDTTDELAKEGVSGRWVLPPCRRPAGASELQRARMGDVQRRSLGSIGTEPRRRAIALVFSM